LLLSGQMLECPVLDHVIVTDYGYYSYTDEGMLKP
jgi:DNA repair protein RadC